MSEQTKTWTVSLQPVCDQCGAIDEASVAAKSCEVARQMVMKMLRYRGWELALKSTRTMTCPKHSAPLIPCAACSDPTPRVYLGLVHQHFAAADDEILSKLDRKGLICAGCQAAARDRGFARRHAEWVSQ